MNFFPDGRSRSAALFKRAIQVLPGGNSRHSVFIQPYPIYAASGAGSRITDVDGVERIDFINNLSSLIHGHCHPKIVSAIEAQASRLISVSMPTEQEIELAELICERLPGVERIRFGNSGTEAVLYAIKAARAFTGRSLIAKIEGAYHGGAETASVSVNPDPARWGNHDFPASVPDRGSSSGVGQDVIVLHMNEVESSRAILRAHAERLAAVIIDPMVKNLGYALATPEFLAMLREETRMADALLIFDEVYSFRLGFNGAQGAVGIIPDLTALGKVIGGGLPIGAVGGRADIMEPLFDPRGSAPRLSHAGTFNANPLTMAAGVAAMRLLDRPAFDRLSALGERLREGLREVVKIAGAKATVGGAASLACLLQLDAKPGTYRDVMATMAGDPDIGARSMGFFREMLNRGVLMTEYGFMALSTAMDEADVDHCLTEALTVLRRMGGSGA